ncbi:hypothetical protein EG68_02229 [Paragonimus skrjabini miyazakii]|uniref:Troponin I n=1 Tax=Paragonimus skrjabini miyazakii TaxID=59628 RepID=A0A8S9Z4L6_9TREM|nr:hypothetical protein EG68_02229 [Paragonimus skrjabini miyazakii]
MPAPDTGTDRDLREHTHYGNTGDEDKSRPPTTRPNPLTSMPALSIQLDDSNSESSENSDDEDMMTAEEEAAARRYLSGGDQTEQRRMSSLDVYLSQQPTTPEPLLINRRLSMREEQEEIAKMNTEDEEKNEKLDKEREAVRREREAKAEMKSRRNSTHSPSPSPRKMTFTKRGIGGLSRERRKKLKEIIMRKAQEELKAERFKEMHAREDHLKSVVPSCNVDALNESQLQELLYTLHKKAKESEAQRLELEERLRRQEEEIQELTLKLTDVKGHYPKPILRKVPKKSNLLARLEKLRVLNAMHAIKPSVILRSTANTGDTTAVNPGLVNGINEGNSNR